MWATVRVLGLLMLSNVDGGVAGRDDEREREERESIVDMSV